MRRPFFPVLALGVFLTFSLSFAANPPVPDPPPHPAPPVDFAHLPWIDGESLTYDVSWSGLEAAEGTFTAHDKGDHWEFNLKLASAGAVNEIYPFSGDFWSILAPNPWRSLQYGEYRFEPHRTIKEETQIDYVKRIGIRQMWIEGKTKTFPIAEEGVDDVGTMLYHIRAVSWKPGDKRTFYVYESNSEKRGEGECQALESRAFGAWHRQALLRVLMLPGKGTHHRGRLMVWMTDDARHLPLHAEIEFRYGSFSMDLVRAEKLLPAGP